MELVIILAVVAVGVWYFVFRDKKIVAEAITEAPYKVDVAPVVQSATVETVVEKAPEPVVEKPAEPIAVAPVKAKRPAKPKAAKTPAKPKTEKTPAKAPAKPRAKKAPTMTVAK